MAGYIVGFPFDTPESIHEDIEIIKKELPLDILGFMCLVPLPGSDRSSAPSAGTGLLLNLGDMFHADNQRNVTVSGHQLVVVVHAEARTIVPDEIN